MLVDDQALALAVELGHVLQRRGLRVVTAESCTGGLVAAAITSVAGSSAWFERGYVTYANDAKEAMLGVPAALLERHGAVSEPVAQAMAQGACERAGADCGVAVTGIAGPAGGTPDKAVGTVCFGFVIHGRAETVTRHFDGDRATVRAQSVAEALGGLIERLRSVPERG